jgi:hypothetical protein
LRRELHDIFDKLWERGEHHRRSRHRAYRWLAAQLGMAVEACHVGSFDADTCARAIALCVARMSRTDAEDRERDQGPPPDLTPLTPELEAKFKAHAEQRPKKITA